MIINLTPESKKTLMSEHRNNIQVAIDALYSQRRRKSPGDESETLTRRNDAIFGNHVWQTFAKISRQDLKNRLCRKNHSYGVIWPTTPSGEAE